MYSYTVSKTANNKEFIKACHLIESNFNGISKQKVLVDVDGSTIQVYHKNDSKIKVCNDYEVDAVYVDSEIELKSLF